MTTDSNRVFTCGACAISIDHKPGEPTVFDKVASAIKAIGKSGRSSVGTYESGETRFDRGNRAAKGSAA